MSGWTSMHHTLQTHVWHPLPDEVVLRFAMDLPELSLAPSWSRVTPECSSSESSDTSPFRKRKAISDNIRETKSLQAACNNIIDLQHCSERLPLDWEQCLDLESGRMYFLNRKTLKKSWDRPITTKDKCPHHYSTQKLDLELNISPTVSNKPKTSAVVTNKLCSTKKAEQTVAQTVHKDGHGRSIPSAGAVTYKEMKSNDNMVAMACINCHMLVIVSKSSPTCPNCKFVHSIPPPAAQQISPAPVTKKPTTFKPLDTLTLFS